MRRARSRRYARACSTGIRAGGRDGACSGPVPFIARWSGIPARMIKGEADSGASLASSGPTGGKRPIPCLVRRKGSGQFRARSVSTTPCRCIGAMELWSYAGTARGLGFEGISSRFGLAVFTGIHATIADDFMDSPGGRGRALPPPSRGVGWWRGWSIRVKENPRLPVPSIAVEGSDERDTKTFGTCPPALGDCGARVRVVGLRRRRIIERPPIPPGRAKLPQRRAGRSRARGDPTPRPGR